MSTTVSGTPVKLVAKLVEVMKAVERIPKNGWNDFHKYHYALEADINEALRGELASRNVLLLPAVTGRSRESVGEKGQVVTHLDMEFTFYDAETGEQLTRPWLGAGADKEDKGAYKAMTGGEKYFLLKTFLIPTGDDPEGEAAVSPQRQAPRKAAPSKPTTPPKPATITADQRTELADIASEHGWKPEDVTKLLKDTFGVDRSKEVPMHRFEALKAELRKKGKVA